MKTILRVGLGLLVVMIAFGGNSVFAAEEVTLEGNFVWVRSDGEQGGDLKAIFTDAGKGMWNVAFHFEWEDGPHVYTGTAQGSLTGGELKGEVKNDNKEREGTFVFKGQIEDGVFSGTHGYVDDGKVNDSGTLTLQAKM